MSTKLDKLSFSSRVGLNARLITYRYEQLARFFKGRTCLELGCADGQSLAPLLARFDEVVAVDGSAKLLASLRESIDAKHLTLVHSMFESLALARKFDTVILGHVLEHVDDPRRVIRVAMRHLVPSGVLVADVPNANSIHRRIGVKLGMIGKVTDLNDADRSIGHQRVYTPERFRREFTSLGLRVVHAGGFFLKPLSNAQMDAMLDERQLAAFLELGKDLPELAAEIYVVCRLPSRKAT